MLALKSNHTATTVARPWPSLAAGAPSLLVRLRLARLVEPAHGGIQVAAQARHSGQQRLDAGVDDGPGLQAAAEG